MEETTQVVEGLVLSRDPEPEPVAPIEEPAQPPEQQAIRVRVVRRAGSYPEITSNHAIPPIPIIRSMLPSEFKKHVRVNRWSTLEDLILHSRGRIAYDIWADAIARATVLAQGADDQAEGFAEKSVIPQDAYVAMGDTLFKLQPVRTLGKSKALAALKTKLRESTRKEKEYIINGAKLAASGLVRQATLELHEVETKKYELEKQMRNTVPPWVADHRFGNRPVHLHNSRWAVGLVINFQIFEWHWSRGLPDGSSLTYKMYAPTPIPRPVQTLLWVPIKDDKGSYEVNSIFVDSSFNPLPHIGHGHACMTLQGKPATLTHNFELEVLQEKIEDFCSVVNLGSPLTGADRLLRYFPEFVPEELKAPIQELRVGTFMMTLPPEQQEITNTANSWTPDSIQTMEQVLGDDYTDQDTPEPEEEEEEEDLGEVVPEEVDPELEALVQEANATLPHETAAFTVQVNRAIETNNLNLEQEQLNQLNQEEEDWRTND